MEEPFRPRVVGLARPTQTAPTPVNETISVADAAKRLGISVDTCRKWIRQDMVDGAGRVPGGRCLDTMYIVIRAVFERAMRDGHEPERIKPAPEPTVDLPAIRAHLAAIAELVADAS